MEKMTISVPTTFETQDRKTALEKDGKKFKFKFVFDLEGVTAEQLLEAAESALVIRAQARLRTAGEKALKEADKAGEYRVKVTDLFIVNRGTVDPQKAILRNVEKLDAAQIKEVLEQLQAKLK